MSKYKRVILKLSGEALAGKKGNGFNEKVVLNVGEQVKKLISKGVQISIVIGGGNFWRGRSNKNMDRCKADQIGMLATIMNSIYVAEMFQTIGIKTTVLNAFPMDGITQVFSKELAIEKMEKGEVVFFAGGIGHPYFSTDTAVVLRALEVEADIILLAKNIDGVYDLDPKENNNAKKYDEISLSHIIEKKLNVIDLTAAIMCLENNLPLYVFYLGENDSIINSLSRNSLGTYIYI